MFFFLKEVNYGTSSVSFIKLCDECSAAFDPVGGRLNCLEVDREYLGKISGDLVIRSWWSGLWLRVFLSFLWFCRRGSLRIFGGVFTCRVHRRIVVVVGLVVVCLV